MSCTSNNNYEVLLSEYHVLKQKLESKTEALLILSKELEECRNGRDHWKCVSDQLKSGRYAKNRQNIDNKILTQNLCETKEKNKILQIEIKDLQQKLKDCEGDVKVLREQITRQRLRTNSSNGDDDIASNARYFSAHDRGRLVEHLESLKMKYALLERDLQSVLDEKEELITERDAYKHKVERLNHELNVALKGDDKKVIDIDSILMENRYLQERLKQTQEEKSLYIQTLSKYKNILEKRRNKSALKLGSNGGGSVIITHKQVEQMLQDTSLSQLPTTQATIADLRSLALALFESLNDKNIALSHQKKTNKILGHRLAELEEKLSTMVGFPSIFVTPDALGSFDENNAHENCVLNDYKCDKGPPNLCGNNHDDEDFVNDFEKDPTKKILIEANNNTNGVLSDLTLRASESMESLIRSRHPSVVSEDSRSPVSQSPTKNDRPNVKTSPHFYSSTMFNPGSDEDMPLGLRKLVQDAMKDLDRRLLHSSIGSLEELLE